MESFVIFPNFFEIGVFCGQLGGHFIPRVAENVKHFVRPINVGHTLVIPKNHYENIYEISEKEIAYLYKIVKRIAYATKKAVGSEGIRIIQNNGKAAGQVIFHLHVHIIPMYSDFQWRHPDNRDQKMLDQDAKKIKQAVSKKES